jgi:cytochrome bd-type quinol oxidase subunit 1
MKTGLAASPSVSTGYVIATLAGFTLLYTVLGVIDLGLMATYARRDLGGGEPEPAGREREDVLIY